MEAKSERVSWMKVGKFVSTYFEWDQNRRLIALIRANLHSTVVGNEHENYSNSRQPQYSDRQIQTISFPKRLTILGTRNQTFQPIELYKDGKQKKECSKRHPF